MNAADRRREDRKREGAGRERGANPELDTDARQTPNADMQDEDAGTAASGNESPGSASDSAMKRPSKTPRGTADKR